MQKDEMNKELKKAEIYNKKLSIKILSDPFASSKATANSDYYKILDLDGIIGHIIIPSIDVNLPIYHGTSEEVLKKGAGHMAGTSFPIGGDGTNAVISGHRGLPSSKLFTDLDKVKEGDKFYIKVLDKTLTYKVNQIKVIKPEDTRDLMTEKGMDCVTLVTCTPYGINSHRLIVRGVRVPDESTVAAVKYMKKTDNTILYIILSASIIILAFIILLVLRKCKRSAKSIN